MSEQDDKESVDAKDLLRWAEETQRNINFIVNQQAQFNTDMQQLRETQARSEQRWERTEESVRNLLAIAQSHENEISALSDGQVRLTEAQARLTEAQVRLTEAQAQTNNQMSETGERLNALINFVERRASGESNSGTDAREV